MKEIAVDTIINAPLRVVWSVLTDFSGYQSWNPFLTRIEGTFREGESLSVDASLPGGKTVTFTPEIFKIREEKGFAWEGSWASGVMLRSIHSFELKQVNPGSVQFVQREEFSGIGTALKGGVLKEAREGYALMNRALKERAQKVAGLM